MRRFLFRHPFIDSLVKRGIRIVFTWNVILACLIATVAVIGVVLAVLAGVAGDSSGGIAYNYIYGKGESELLSVRIGGTILGSNDSQGSLSGFLSGDQTYGYDVKDELYAAADDDVTKGVILEIDSPGGTIYGAHAIADGVAYYKAKTHKPVYAHIEGEGASGAYWAASSADKIFADYGSDVGSIGVIMGPFEYYDTILSEDGGLLGGGVMTQNGIQTVTITAGTSKDIGSPYRKLTPQEIQALQKTVDNEYDTFVRYVSERRHIPETTIRQSIGAMIYDPKTAADLHLIDGVGSRQDAYDALAAAIHKKDDYHVVREETAPSFVASLLGALSRSPQPQASLDLCGLTKSPLAYHGDVSAWCGKR